MRRSFQFEPVNRGALWTRLNLTTAQVAALCDLTTRQVSYWAQKGFLPHSPQNPERFNGDAVDMCILIKQGLESGFGLTQAARRAQAHLAAELQAQPQMANFAPPVLTDIHEKLVGVASTVRLLLEVIAPQLPPADAEVVAADSPMSHNGH